MNKSLVKMLLGITVSLHVGYMLATTFGKTTFIPRSSGINDPLQKVGVTNFLVPCDMDCLNGFASVSVGYNRSFDRDEIGKYFFYNGTNIMRVGTVDYVNTGFQTAALPGVDIFSENLFLNNNGGPGSVYDGLMIALPDVQRVEVDIDFRLNLDEWVCGLYFEAHTPITWARFDMNISQEIANTGTSIMVQTLGNLADAPSPIAEIVPALNGQILDPDTFPLLKERLNFGRVDGAQTKTRLADIEAAVGYNLICCDAYHVGFDVRAIFPTGNHPDAEFWFEPVVGNGHQFGFGVGANAHGELWNNECDSALSVWASGKAYHMFRAKQRRIFDLKNPDGTQNVGSSRLLIKKFIGAPAAPALSEVLYGPNVLALQCKVKNDVQGEFTVFFDYQRCGLTFDTGYKLWARTKDKISLSDQLPPNTFGVKGATNTDTTLGTGNRTASVTDIRGNSIIDGGTLGTIADNVYITNDSISIESAEQPTSLSHSVFAHLGYAWDCYDYTPFVGIGGMVEFSGRANNALDLWGIWAKVGFAFA